MWVNSEKALFNYPICEVKMKEETDVKPED